MEKARQLDRLIEELDADERTAIRQAEGGEVGKFVEWNLFRGLRGVGALAFAAPVIRGDGEDEAGAEGMGGAPQAAQIHGLANSFDADAEIAAHGSNLARRSAPRQGV